MARSRVFAGMKWKFFRVRKRRERTFIHNLCPLCGRRWGASSADRVGRDPCVPPRSTHCSRRGTRAPPYRVRRSYGADRVVRPYTFCAGRGGRRPLRTLSLRASPQTGAAIRFSSARPPLDKPAGMGIIINRRGRCDKRSAPLRLMNLMVRKNRHRAGWRFLSFNFITRIETEYRPMWKVSIQYMYVTPFRGCD